MKRRRMIDVLWGSRKQPDARVQETLARAALYTLHPARNVKATPINPPIRKENPSA